MCGFDGTRKRNYSEGDPAGRSEVEVRVGKLKNEKATSKDKITEEMAKGEGDRMIDWMWRLCNMVFESSVVPGDCRSAVIVLLSLYRQVGLN